VRALQSAAASHRSVLDSRSSLPSRAQKHWGDLSIEEVFAKVDTDGSGTLDQEEVDRLAAALGVVMSEQATYAMFAEMDSDGNGEVDLDEFKGWWEANYSAYLEESAQGATGA
jgi:Ca2+-binding EF-hand superfamily protein